MGKAGKSRRHDERMKARRAAKHARQAEYAALAGTSKKRKKGRNISRFSSGKHRHLIPNCGNIGCARCYPQFAKKTHKELADAAA